MTYTTTDQPRVLRLRRAQHLSGDVLAVFALVFSITVLGFFGAGGTLAFVLGVPLVLFAPESLTREVAPALGDEGLRLTSLLCRGDAPANPTTASATEHASLRVNGTD